MMTVNPDSLHGMPILIAEDDAIICMMLEDVVEQLGGVVVGTAVSCADAIRILDGELVRLIILDVHLQGGTSEAVVDAAVARGVPILVSSGSDAQGLPPKFRGLPLLSKPWTVREATQAVGLCLGGTASVGCP